MSYWTKEEQKKFEELMKMDDTVNCWIATRINGASAGMACNGNISLELLKKLDEKVLPLIKN